MPTLPGKLPPYRRLQKLIDWLNGLRDYVATLKPTQSYNTLTSHTGVGVRRQSLGTEGGTAGKLQFRGEFGIGFSYSSSNLVRISLGTEAGTYMAVKDVPANPTSNPLYLPWTGQGYWVLLARLTDQTSWL